MIHPAIVQLVCDEMYLYFYRIYAFAVPQREQILGFTGLSEQGSTQKRVRQPVDPLITAFHSPWNLS